MADFHCPHRTNHDAGYAKVGDGDDAESGGKESATTLVCRVGDSFSPSREGYWEGDEGGVGGMWCNPYAGAVLLVPEADDAIGKRKVFMIATCPPHAMFGSYMLTTD